MDTGSLDERLTETLSIFDGSSRPQTTMEVANALDLGRRGTYDRLKHLAERGCLETKKVGANARVWWRPPSVGAPATNGSVGVDSFVTDLLGDVGIAVFVLDADLDVVWLNSTSERYFGLDREANLGRHKPRLLEERIAPRFEESDAFRERVLATYEDNTYVERFECRLTADDREERWLEHRSKPIESGPYAGGRIECYYDITERKRSELAHREASDELGSLIDAVEEYAIFSLDPDGYVQTWNRGAERIKGYAADEIRGEHFSTFYTEADREAEVPERNLADAARQGSVEDEGWRVRADGSRFWADVTITAVRDDDGELEGYVKVTRDTTDQMRADAERELLHETTRAIAEADTFEDGLQTALQAVCERTDWAYAEAWTPTDEGTLRRAETDSDDGGHEYGEFAAFSESITFDRGEGLPGRVWASGSYEWVTDLSNGTVDRYPRVERALDAGFRSALGVPIVADGEVVTVLVFLMREPSETDKRMIEVVSSVASDLGALARRRQVEAEMERERDLIDQILETSPVSIMVLDGEGSLARINDRAREMLAGGADLSDSYPTGGWEVYDTDGNRVPVEERPAFRALATGESVSDWECRVEGADGEIQWLTVNAEPILDSDGEVRRVVTTGEDITRIKEQARLLERERDELEAELDEVFDRISDGFYGLDSDLRFTVVNEQCADLLDVERSAAVGTDIRDEVPLSDSLEEALRRALRRQEAVSLEEYSAQQETWFEYRIHPSETGLSVYFRDVTERKERQRELEESERRYRTLVDNFPNGAVALVDEDLRYTVFGGTMVGDWELTASELEGELLEEVLPTELAEVMVPAYSAALAGETRSFVDRVADSVYQFQFIPVRDEAGDVFAAMGMSQDITEEKKRERELEARVRQQRVVTTLGQRALEDRTLDDLFSETVTRLADTLGSTHSKILKLDPSGEELLLRDGVGWDEDLVGSATVSATKNDSQAAYTLAVEQPVVVEDLETESRFSGPALLTDHDVRSGISTVIGPVEDPWGILAVHDTTPRTFSEHDASFVQTVATILSSAVARRDTGRELVRQREQLTVLNQFNEVVQEVTSAVIEQSTREEIEAAVCDRLATSESYLFAWIGDVDTSTQTVVPRAEAGTEGYLDEITISVDADDDRSTGPTGRALLTGEIQTAQDIDTSASHDPWREVVDQYDFRAAAAIPLVHEGTVYGVLNLYTERPRAFEEQERTVIAQLGEIVGHAIAAAERKQALVSDELVELGVRVPGLFESVETAGTITLDHTVQTGDGEYLVYGSATEEALDSVRTLVETQPEWEAVRFHSEGNPSRFEIRTDGWPLLTTIASFGGYIESAVIESGTLRMTIHLAPTVDVRAVVDSLTAAFPGVEMLRRHQISRTHDDSQRQLMSELTDRQRTTLEAAYAAGFFEWPRDASGEEIAESMGVSPPTFHQHLRKAERKVFESLFSTAVRSAG